MLKGHIQHTTCTWCFMMNQKVTLPQLVEMAVKAELKGIEFASPAEWPVLKERGLICPMVMPNEGFTGLNRRENHEKVVGEIVKTVELTGAAGFPNVVCFSGDRKGTSDEEGAKNCIEGLKKAAVAAEKAKVTLCLELLNSKVDHKDYMCDRTAWGAAVVRAVGSPRVKLLYDIYHMQVQEGDVIATIRQYHDCIGHYHTAGVPGRHELDDKQELNYPAIMREIVKTGYNGYVGHEFVPTGDPLTGLRQAVAVCDV